MSGGFGYGRECARLRGASEPMKKLIRFLINLWQAIVPPPQWRVPVIILCGIFVGIGGYVLHVSNATSYLSSDPEACINCHVMTTAYATWQNSSHAEVATCTDCHLPHDNIFHKYWFKANDGLRHTTIFTMRTEPQVIRIKESGAKAVQQNCIHCHENVMQEITAGHAGLIHGTDDEGRYCWDCHRQTPHGRVRSLSATPYAHTPDLPTAIPQWFRSTFKETGESDQKGEGR